MNKTHEATILVCTGMVFGLLTTITSIITGTTTPFWAFLFLIAAFGFTLGTIWE